MPPTEATLAKHHARVDALARVLDNAYRIPGTSVRIGWDALIGLIPGVGDLLTAGLALGIVGSAWRLGARKRVLLRMLANLTWDATLGVIPIVGDVLDVLYKANCRNVRLLQHELTHQRALTAAKPDNGPQR